MTSTENAERAATQHIVEMYLPPFTRRRDEWNDLWADDGMIEFPYAPQGRRSRYIGKTEIPTHNLFDLFDASPRSLAEEHNISRQH